MPTPFWGPQPVPKPLTFPAPATIPAGSSLKDIFKGIDMRQRMSATGPTNVAMTSPVTIHGVPTDRQGGVGAEVQRALRDPIDNLWRSSKRQDNVSSD